MRSSDCLSRTPVLSGRLCLAIVRAYPPGRPWGETLKDTADSRYLFPCLEDGRARPPLKDAAGTREGAATSWGTLPFLNRPSFLPCHSARVTDGALNREPPSRWSESTKLGPMFKHVRCYTASLSVSQRQSDGWAVPFSALLVPTRPHAPAPHPVISTPPTPSFKFVHVVLSPSTRGAQDGPGLGLERSRSGVRLSCQVSGWVF